MHNVKIKTQGNRLTIEIDTSDGIVKASPLSSTGKTRLLATTQGAHPLDIGIPGATVALNVMIPPAT